MDAPAAGRRLAGAGITPDLTLCSSAARTRETWKLFVGELPQRPKTVYDDRLYEASLGELIALLNETSDEVTNLLVVGHNPAMHALADALAGETEGDLLARMNRGGSRPRRWPSSSSTVHGSPSSTAWDASPRTGRPTSDLRGPCACERSGPCA